MEPNLSTIRARRAEITRLQAALTEEANELEIAERVLTRLAATSRGNGAPNLQSQRVAAPATQTDLIVATLRMAAEPWFESPAALHAEIKRTHGVKLKNTSFQPLLSNLKKRGIVVRDGVRIALAERVRQGAETLQVTELLAP